MVRFRRTWQEGMEFAALFSFIGLVVLIVAVVFSMSVGVSARINHMVIEDISTSIASLLFMIEKYHKYQRISSPSADNALSLIQLLAFYQIAFSS